MEACNPKRIRPYLLDFEAMTTTIILNEEQTRKLIRETLIDLMEERPSEFRQLILEAMEEIALAHAIREGRKNAFVSEEDVFAVLHKG